MLPLRTPRLDQSQRDNDVSNLTDEPAIMVGYRKIRVLATSAMRIGAFSKGPGGDPVVLVEQVLDVRAVRDRTAISFVAGR